MSDEKQTTQAELINLDEQRAKKKSEMLWIRSSRINSLLAVVYIVFVLMVVLMMTGCKTKPDAYLCVIVHKTAQPFAACKNLKTGDEMDVPLEQTHKWIATDLDSYEAIRNWYKRGCK